MNNYLLKPYWIITLLLLFSVACTQAPVEQHDAMNRQPTTQKSASQPASTDLSTSLAADNQMDSTQISREVNKSPESMDGASSVTLDLSHLSEEEQAIAIASAYEPVASALSNVPEHKAFAYSVEDGDWEVEFFTPFEDGEEGEEGESSQENEENEEGEENEENNEGDEGNQEGNEDDEEGEEDGEEGEWLGYVLLNLSSQEIIEYEIVQLLSEEELTAAKSQVQTALLQHPEITALIGDAAGWNIELEYDPYEQAWFMYLEKEVAAWLAEAVIEEEQVMLINISDPMALNEDESAAFQQEQAIELAYESSNAAQALNGIDNWTTYVAKQENGQYGVSFLSGEKELYFALVDVEKWQVLQTVP